MDSGIGKQTENAGAIRGKSPITFPLLFPCGLDCLTTIPKYYSSFRILAFCACVCTLTQKLRTYEVFFANDA